MLRAAIAFLLSATVFTAVVLLGETPPAAGVGMKLTATTANVGGAPDAVRFEILRWSTGEERDRLMAAWNNPSSPDNAGGGRGAGKLGKGKGAAKGKGAGKAPPASEGVAITPESSLARALQEAASVGYLWSSETAGYALRFAAKVDNPGGSQRILLITQRRLGAMNQRWLPTYQGMPNTDEFSVIELRLNAKGEGEGKVSLTGKVAPDPSAQIVAIENYDALPVVFSNARIQIEQDGPK